MVMVIGKCKEKSDKIKEKIMIKMLSETVTELRLVVHGESRAQ